MSIPSDLPPPTPSICSDHPENPEIPPLQLPKAAEVHPKRETDFKACEIGQRAILESAQKRNRLN